MKKNEIIEETKKELNMSDKQCQKIINIIFTSISNQLKKGKTVKIRNFGTFKTNIHKDRNGRNPRDGKPIHIPSKKVIKLEVSKDLKKSVQNI